MEDLITLQPRLSHSVSWQMQLGTSELNVFWVREDLGEFIEGVWKTLIRLVNSFLLQEDEKTESNFCKSVSSWLS